MRFSTLHYNVKKAVHFWICGKACCNRVAVRKNLHIDLHKLMSAGASYSPLTETDRANAGYCYDTTTLLPVYNPMAVLIPDNSNGTVSMVAVSPISTLLAFGWAFGTFNVACAS